MATRRLIVTETRLEKQTFNVIRKVVVDSGKRIVYIVDSWDSEACSSLQRKTPEEVTRADIQEFLKELYSESGLMGRAPVLSDTDFIELTIHVGTHDDYRVYRKVLQD